jgi:hypothetical protein
MDPLLAGALIALMGAFAGAIATHWLERSARNEERAEARRSKESHISTDAYALRRQLQSWLRASHVQGAGVKRAQAWAKLISPEFAAAEIRASRIAAAAAEISSNRAAAARRAYVLFHEAVTLLNRAAAGDFIVWQRKDDPDRVFVRPGAADLLEEARAVLTRCVAELEKAVDEALLRAEDESARLE